MKPMTEKHLAVLRRHMVEIVDMQAAPTRLRVRFAGTLMGNDSHAVKITDGEFSYSE